ncbi:MAG: TRAP transporter substrate-binding protein DctP [Desulfopila sp.]
MKKTLSFIMLCVALAGTAPAALAKMTLKYGFVAPPSHPEVIAGQAFADYVQEKTGGEITIDVFPMGQLGGERSMVEQVQGGTLDMMDCTAAVLSNFVPEVALFDLPFLWPNREVAYAVMGDPEFFKIYSDAFPRRGFVTIGYGENQMRDLTNVKREVRTPEDVKGMKIRVMESPIYLETWRTLGASPVPMPFPEVYNGLQQGVIDAQENPIMTSIMMKFTEVSPYVTLTNYILTETFIIFNIDLWEQLTPEQQQIFRDGAAIMTKQNREEGVRVTEEMVAELEKGGTVKITRLTDAERAAFREAVKPVYGRFEKEVGMIPDKSEYGSFAGKSYLQLFEEKIKQYQQ